MPRPRKIELDEPLPERPRGKSLEAREQQMIGYATDLAEIQLRNGTASPLVISHYLKLGSSREILEQERIRFQNELSAAKTEAIQEREHLDELFKNAMNAIGRYRGNPPQEDYQ